MNKLEDQWHTGLIKCLAEELWVGYKHWELETHNIGEVLWSELSPERKNFFLNLARQINADREKRGLELKRL